VKKVVIFLSLIVAGALTLGTISSISSYNRRNNYTGTQGVLTMATCAQFPPYDYKNGSDIVGIDPEIAAKIAEKLNLSLEIIDMDFSDIFNAVRNGEVDIGMMSLTVTPERKKIVNFTTKYAIGTQVIIIPEESKFSKAEDLSVGGYAIGVVAGSTAEQYITNDFGQNNTITGYKTGYQLITALISGNIHCVVIDGAPATSLIEGKSYLKILDSPYMQERYAIAYSKKNEVLGEKLNRAIKELVADGTVDEIIQKYMG
jgi:ABC-type amino acid transport substrate-binding protein